jgi:integrase
MKSTSKKRTPSIVNLTVKRRYLTQREIERLMECARKHGRYGHRDATMILVAYRHGLRASEVCDLQWQQIELSEGSPPRSPRQERNPQCTPNPR